VVSDDPTRFEAGSQLIEAPSGRVLTVRGSRRRRGALVVAFADVVDRTLAEDLRGARLMVRADHARRLGPKEYWDHDLIGCEVITLEGAVVGRVEEVLHAPANEVLVVRGESREHLVPLIMDVVREIRPRERITIDPIPGLLEE
jgi:16S rRNA processing protein RimM